MAYETLTFRPSKENKTLLAQLAKLAKHLCEKFKQCRLLALFKARSYLLF